MNTIMLMACNRTVTGYYILTIVWRAILQIRKTIYVAEKFKQDQDGIFEGWEWEVRKRRGKYFLHFAGIVYQQPPCDKMCSVKHLM